MRSHVPNVAMSRNNGIAKIDFNLVPTSNEAKLLYENAGGNVTSMSTCGTDTLSQSENKKVLRNTAFNYAEFSFNTIFLN